MTTDDIRRRIAQAIINYGTFSADTIAHGNVTAAQAGGAFSGMKREGLIVVASDVAGLREWEGTPDGIEWATNLLAV